MEYDDRGRIFKNSVFAVDEAAGLQNPDSQSLDALVTGYWYDQRGNLVKTSNPGGLVNKTQYDKTDRPVVQSTTEGGGDVAAPTAGTWEDAMGLSGDLVLAQVETEYDRNGNPIFQGSRELDGLEWRERRRGPLLRRGWSADGDRGLGDNGLGAS